MKNQSLFVCALLALAPMTDISAETLTSVRPPEYGEVSEAGKIYANLWYKGAWDTQTASYGIYAFPSEECNPGNFASVVLDGKLCGNAGAVYANGKYFVATSEEVSAPNGGYVVMSMRFNVFDTHTWQSTEIADADEEFKAMDMSYDAMTDKVYGCFVKRGTDGYYYFGTLDIDTGRTTMIRNYGQESRYAFTGVAVSGNGTVYAINADGGLYTIDKKSGIATKTGDTGLQNQYMTSATCDPVTGKIYYALNSDLMCGMYEINPVNCVVKRLYSFSDEESLAGMYIPDKEPGQDAPAGASGLTATFTGGSLQGKITFTAPATTFSGAGLTGNLDWSVTANGVEVATGAAAAGNKVECNVTVPEAGEYSFAVVFSNSSGEGAVVRTGMYVGPDMPLPPADVRLELQDDNRLVLTWSAGGSAHGGWLDEEALKYVVTRADGSKAGETAGTRFEEKVTDMNTRARYQYAVAAACGDFVSEAVSSGAVFAGSYRTPHTENFDDRAATEDFVVDDGDGDGKSWVWQEGQMHSSICLDGQVDDMLILPPVHLERGMSYRVSVRAKATRSPLRVYPERIAIWAGSAADRQSLNVRILDPTDITTDSYETVSAVYTPSATGPYRFGVQGCSDPDNYYLWIDDFTVSEPVSSDVPNPVERLNAEPGEDGALQVELSCTLPSKTMTGTTLTAIKGVEIYRDKTLLATISGQPGENFVYNDVSVTNGEHTYGIAVTSGAGRGLEESVAVYVGVREAESVRNISAVRGDNNAQLKLKWDAPVRDVAGITLPEGSVTYRVTRYDRSATVVAENLTADEFVDDIANAGSVQEFVQYSVEAVNVAGISEAAWSNTTTYGPLIASPMHESFADGVATQEFVVERDDDNSSWTVTNPASNPGISEQDEDNGMLRFTGVLTGSRADFISGNYAVTDLVNPALVFHFLYPNGCDNGLTAIITSQRDAELVTEEVDVRPDPRLDGWQRCIIPLGSDIDNIQFTFSGINNYEYATSIFVDNISLIDLPASNVTLHPLLGPAVVEANIPFMLTAFVENSGSDEVDATVSLFLNESLLETRQVTLGPSQMEAVEFMHTLSPVNPKELIYHAEADTPGDKVAEDNRSEGLAVGVHHNVYPAPYDAVAVTGADGKPIISWKAPDLGPREPQRITDDVEGYEPFSTGLPNSVLASDYMGLWTSVDADGLYTMGVGHNDVPIPNACDPKAFMVFNGKAGNIGGEVWEARSGESMFVAFTAIADSGMGNDDWLISPLLPGISQEVSLWARSATALYGLESMEILYSERNADTEDFKILKKVSEMPAHWTEYKVNLPEGALYFAIRCTSANLFALCVDDITFTQAGYHAMGLVTEGYNVYRDYQLLKSVGAGVTSLVDPAEAEKGTLYHVTAKYNFGESRPSNEARLDESGIDDAFCEPGISVTTLPGVICINGASGMDTAVYIADGRCVASGRSSTYSVAPGIYVVTVGQHAFKVTVK